MQSLKQARFKVHASILEFKTIIKKPFNVDLFFEVFGVYNTATLSAQGLVYMLGILAFSPTFRENTLSVREFVEQYQPNAGFELLEKEVNKCPLKC